MSDENVGTAGGLQRSDRKDNLPTDTSIRLTHRDVLDLSGMSQDQIAELKKQHSSGLINIANKAHEMRVDVDALDASLSSFNDQTAKATAAGAHATITHTQTTTLGRTEVVIGNTDRAASGKISRSGAGERDVVLWVVGIIAVAGIIIAMIAFRH